MKQNRETLAIAFACRRFLYLNGFLSESESDKVHERMMKYQNRMKIRRISEEQIDSVEFVYND